MINVLLYYQLVYSVANKKTRSSRHPNIYIARNEYMKSAIIISSQEANIVKLSITHNKPKLMTGNINLRYKFISINERSRYL
jgi:hypothetical protein